MPYGGAGHIRKSDSSLRLLHPMFQFPISGYSVILKKELQGIVTMSEKDLLEQIVTIIEPMPQTEIKTVFAHW
jgi:hypothetical protein